MLYGIILAGGKSSRFNGNKHKSLYPMWGKEIIKYNVDLLKKYTDDIYVVIGENQKEEFSKVLKDVIFVIQSEPKGTADAYNCALNQIKKDGIALVCNADTLMLEDFIPKFLLNYVANNSLASLLAVSTHTDASAIIKKRNSFYIDEANKNHLLKNSGYYLFDTKESKKIMHKIPLINGEYYITKIFDYIDKKSLYEYKEINHYYSCNTKSEYQNTINHIQRYIQDKLIKENVILSGNCQIDFTSIINSNTTLTNASVRGKSIIKSNCIIDNSIIENSTIENDVHIGPFSHLRDNCHIQEKVHIGNFVEMKNTNVGSKTKIKHQCLLNDCEIGSYVNIGAGTITANYDGLQKHKTIIKDQAFIGCNSTLIAPLIIDKNALIAAGSIITDNVSPSTLAIARTKQINKQRKQPL
ncbi:MAG: glycosyltransferase [Erysipelotrichaceae bacterium]|nr:glycosyltransferase [Erysipelotrichaceae bacterium]